MLKLLVITSPIKEEGSTKKQTSWQKFDRRVSSLVVILLFLGSGFMPSVFTFPSKEHGVYKEENSLMVNEENEFPLKYLVTRRKNMSDQKSLAENQSAQTDDRVLGSTRRRFGNNLVFKNPLIVADPSTYRPGVSTLFNSLLRMNRYEFQQSHYRDEEERIDEVLQILAE
ncbi:MAG: hypothetical protein GF308_16090, partial [Candidatus Heimdallarchaeota archaeon]|nr:hypothetical protein [Candidatus Heimdallarchaeota archaeon]